MPNLPRSVLVIGAPIAAVLLTSGCGSTKQLSQYELETKVYTDDHSVLRGVSPLPGKIETIDCAGGIAEKKGATQQCTAKANGFTFHVTIKVQSTDPLKLALTNPQRID